MCTSTDTGTWRGLRPSERHEIVAALKERGLHLTAQREAVSEAVFGCDGHICAEHILKKVSGSRPHLKVNKTTVYRSLYLLMELGLVVEHRCADGRAQYEPAYRGHHSHMMCRKCGRMLDLDREVMDSLRRQLRDRHGFQVDLESYPLLGLCSACRS